MDALGIIVLVAVGIFVLRLVSRAKAPANMINEVMNTSHKFQMTVQIVRQKMGNLIAPGPLTPAKEAYIAYIDEVGSALFVADGLPQTMGRSFVMEEARAISDLPADETVLPWCSIAVNPWTGAGLPPWGGLMAESSLTETRRSPIL